MGKKLYGQGKSNGSLRKREHVSSEDDAGWLTLQPAREGTPAEDERLSKMEAALHDLVPDVDIAASIVAYAAASDSCDSADAWSAVVSECLDDAGVTLSEDTDVMDVVNTLRKCGALVNLPPPLPPPREGDAVLAVLSEDGEWHAAIVAEEPASGGGALLVRFVQWPKLQRTPRKDVVSLASVAADDGAEDDADGRGEGTCELCLRCIALTFHHLVPKSTHSKYVGKALPPGLPDEACCAKRTLTFKVPSQAPSNSNMVTHIRDEAKKGWCAARPFGA